jgi:hypothetical protein
VRDIEIIDSELRLVAALRRATRERGGPRPSTAPMDELLDERLAHRVDDEIAEFTTGAAMTITARPAIRSTAGRQRHVKRHAHTVLRPFPPEAPHQNPPLTSSPNSASRLRGSSCASSSKECGVAA